MAEDEDDEWRINILRQAAYKIEASDAENTEMKRLYDGWPWRQWVLRLFFGTASALMLGLGVATVRAGDGFGFAFLAAASALAVTCWVIPRNPLSA